PPVRPALLRPESCDSLRPELFRPELLRGEPWRPACVMTRPFVMVAGLFFLNISQPDRGYLPCVNSARY
ncbi:hypothetical protein, partial [Arthrobacter sp. Hiyo1]|uniref:hypothetical protein n=1 Tax=Arthrobacter sp. Hiyo1 TaxID=1588020 RepID=UPI001C0E92D3